MTMMDEITVAQYVINPIFHTRLYIPILKQNTTQTVNQLVEVVAALKRTLGMLSIQ